MSGAVRAGETLIVSGWVELQGLGRTLIMPGGEGDVPELFWRKS